LRAARRALRVMRGFGKRLLRAGSAATSLGRPAAFLLLIPARPATSRRASPNWTTRARLRRARTSGCIDHRHEIELQSIGVTADAVKAAHRVIRGEDDRLQFGGDGFQLAQVDGRLSKEEIEIDGGDGRAGQRRGGVSHQDGFERVPFEQSGDAREQRRGVRELCGLSNDYSRRRRSGLELKAWSRNGWERAIWRSRRWAWRVAMGGGGWQFSWGPQDDAESIAAIHTALDAGVNWIDTAAIYGWGIPKKWWRARWRAAPTSHTSSRMPTGVEREKGDLREPEGGFGAARVRSQPAAAESGDDRSLQIHWPEPDADVEEGWTTLAKLREEGKVRWIGFPTSTPRK